MYITRALKWCSLKKWNVDQQLIEAIDRDWMRCMVGISEQISDILHLDSLTLVPLTSYTLEYVGSVMKYCTLTITCKGFCYPKVTKENVYYLCKEEFACIVLKG